MIGGTGGGISGGSMLLTVDEVGGAVLRRRGRSGLTARDISGEREESGADIMARVRRARRVGGRRTQERRRRGARAVGIYERTQKGAMEMRASGPRVTTPIWILIL